MPDSWNLIISLLFCLVSYIAAGYAFKSFLKVSYLCFGECVLIGAGLISTITLFVSMFLPEALRVTSLCLLLVGVFAGVAKLVRCMFNGVLSGIRKEVIVSYLILFLMVLPLLIGTLYVRLWGDELNMEGPLVRHWLECGNFIVHPQEAFSTYSYPRLWVIMLYQSLCLKGIMHEATGRWLCTFIILSGSIFVWKEYYKYWDFGRWKSLLLASFWMSLVFGPMFAWSVSWYYSTIISILVMMSFYYVVVLRTNEDGSLNLKHVAISSIFMAMVVGIRPDGFLYVPLLMVFIIPWKDFSRDFWRSMQGLVLVLIPSLVIYFGWSSYVSINNFNISTSGNIDFSVIFGRIGQLPHRLLPVTTGMFKLIITEWNQTGFATFCFILCIILIIRLYKHLNTLEKRLLLLLTVPAYKFVLLIFENALYFSEKIRLGRHLMQTAPIIYFLLGFFLIKWSKMRFGSVLYKWSGRVKSLAFSGMLGVIFAFHLLMGSLYAHLPSEMNDYMGHWTQLIQKDYPECRCVQLLYSGNAPPTTRLHPTWYYYATANPKIFSTMKSRIKIIPGSISNRSEYLEILHRNGVDAVLVYSGDEEIRQVTGLNLNKGEAYLLKVEDDYFRIARSEIIPYKEIWVVPWRTKAIKRLIQTVY
jgi:hypothetical protein